MSAHVLVENVQDGIGLDSGREQGTVTTAGQSIARFGGPMRQVRTSVELVQGRKHPNVVGSGENGHVVS